MDTIFALASGGGRAGIAVFRISGPATLPALLRMAGEPLPMPRRASLRKLREPKGGAVIDEGLVLWFPGPASFTGEDMAELHVHGGRAVLIAMIGGLASCPGLRLAEPGEFTRRAFEHGRLDLTSAEGLADLVNAETEAQRQQALRQMQGALGRLYENWREGLVAMLARIEAYIDFPEEDLPLHLVGELRRNLLEINSEISDHLNDQRRGERLRDGVLVALLGPPNVGKSSLLNKLAGRDVAIVSARAGTTRDVIEVHLDLGGYPVTIADTAGLRATEDEIESEGVRRALAHAAQSDLKILMFDAAELPNVDMQTAGLVDEQSILVLNKTDLLMDPKVSDVAGRRAIGTAATTGIGIDRLLEVLTTAVIDRVSVGPGPALTRERHRLALVECGTALVRATQGNEIELVAEDIRLAVRAIGRITGRVDVDEVLDVIFREFCIGK